MTPERHPFGGWLVAAPDEREYLYDSRWLNPRLLVDLPGIVVSGHSDRHVRRVETGERVLYLKREHRVPWRERWKNRLAGSGFVSKSEREGRFLNQLGDFGPRWLAFGEDGRGQAFLLLAELKGDSIADRPVPTELIADWVARLHHQGVDQRDLFGKHIFVDGENIAALDWQRARRQRFVSWDARGRGIANLMATVPYLDGRFLIEYRRAAALLGDGPPALETLRKLCRRQTRTRRIPADVRFVWIDGEAVCATPECAEDVRENAHLLHAEGPTRLTLTRSGITAELTRGKYGWPISRLIAKLRGRSWRSPELREARRLVEGPSPSRLLAFGQRLGPRGGTSFLLTEARS